MEPLRSSPTIENPLEDMASRSTQPPTGWADPNVKSLDCGFQYKPLQQRKALRLLKLLPSSDPTSPIECIMLEQSIMEPVLQYYALSYTWGDIQGEQEITLNGCPVFVTQNLHVALLQLRNVPGLLGDMLKSRHLWIDALCINKQDNDEKKYQVRFMRDIFANADMVVAWLGPDADDISFVLDALSEGKDGPKFTEITRAALMSLLTRPWWRRVWIVQEFMVAEFVWFLCGTSYANAYSVFGGMTDVLRHLAKQSSYITDLKFRDLLSWRLCFTLNYELF